MDTQTVTSFYFGHSVSKGQRDDNAHITVEYDVLSRSIVSTFNQTAYSDDVPPATPISNSFKNGITPLYRDEDGEIIPFFHPFVKGSTFGVSTCLGIDSSLSIQGKIYTNVAKFHIPIDEVWYTYANYPEAVYYWGRDVGIIKRQNITENFSWELIDYKIIK